MPRRTINWGEETAALRELERQGFVSRVVDPANNSYTFVTNTARNERKRVMIRMYRQTASQLLVLLDYLERSGFDIKNYHNYAVSSSDTTVRDATHLISSQTAENLSTTELKESLKQQLENGDDSDVTLIDTIVSVLGLAYISNRLSSAVLERLKSAVMRPDEVVALRHALQDSVKCNVCNKDLSAGELVVGAGSGDKYSLRCLKCGIPEKGTCPNCDRKTGLSGAVKSRLIKMFMCTDCKSNPAATGRDPNTLSGGTYTFGSNV